MYIPDAHVIGMLDAMHGYDNLSAIGVTPWF